MSRKVARPVLAGALLWAAVAVPAAAGVRAVWAVNDGERVDQDDLADPARSSNSAWDGHRVRLFGARNEIVAFQVIVEADPAGLAAVSVALPELRHGESRIAHRPPASDPSLSVGRDIQLFSLHYLDVTRETKASWAWEPGSPAAPPDPLGWKPVVLVPENARAGRGGFPVRVAPSRSQAFWIDVYTGRDRPAGIYAGTLTVTADGGTRELPVELELLDFALPDENSLRAMVYYDPSEVGLYQGRNLDPAYHRFAHRQRIELVDAYDEAAVAAHRGRFDGEDFTKGSGYEGPGEGRGDTIVPASFYGPGPAYRERRSAWKASDAWMTFLGKTFPSVLTFLYLPDEPYPAQYPEVRRIAENVKSNPGPGGRLPTFLTKRIVPDFDDLVDIWCVPPQAFDIPKADAERKKGHQVWFYNGGRPQGPTLTIDSPATDARAVGWIAFKVGADGYFYWHGVHWRHNRQKAGERNQDVWANPITFDNRGQPGKPVGDQGFINGDGVLLYPGEEKLHPEEDRGLAGPCSSVRLANLRRGLQDHLYLTLARERGLDAAVHAALQSVVPRVFSEAGETVGFAETGDAYEAARLKLGRAIAGAGGGAR
jgi:hypothetical protein